MTRRKQPLAKHYDTEAAAEAALTSEGFTFIETSFGGYWNSHDGLVDALIRHCDGARCYVQRVA